LSSAEWSRFRLQQDSTVYFRLAAAVIPLLNEFLYGLIFVYPAEASPLHAITFLLGDVFK
jgi:hypothetical protein